MNSKERIEWKPEYSVDVIDLDVHHRQLFDYLNTLIDASTQSPESNATLHQVLKDLVRYTEYHFMAEERYMERYGYPELMSHRVFHKEFTDELEDFDRQFKSQDPKLSLRVTIYLKNWLIKHILTEDKKYAAFCKAKGVPEH